MIGPLGILSGIEIDEYLRMLLIAAAVSTPLFAYGTIRERRLSSAEDRAPEFLLLIASRLRKGVGLEQAVIETVRRSMRDFLEARSTKRGFSMNALLEEIGRRSGSSSLRMPLSVMRTARELGGVPPELLEEMAHDIERINNMRRERTQRARGVAVTSLFISSALLPFLFGLMTGFFRLYVTVPPSVELGIKTMTLLIVASATLFSGVIAGHPVRYLALAPASMSWSYLIFQVASKVRLA